ncbi:unnamed protein product [Polarella glacialis]|uniref:Uncharacterized protein n=1 Tax=Polarella glacialis TaxID=89957 RepID=A0A813KVY3_POLGL|nr:unnamed protein product [Polarella glacialis]
MLNFIPKMSPSVSLLYGKRPLQRIAIGAKKQQLEIPLAVVADIPSLVDMSVSYVGNKYNALPWKDFVDIKLDARNLIEADVKSALTDLDWFGKVNALYAGKQTEAEIDVAAKTIGAIKPESHPDLEVVRDRQVSHRPDVTLSDLLK